jgi:hypothetical protein
MLALLSTRMIPTNAYRTVDNFIFSLQIFIEFNYTLSTIHMTMYTYVAKCM